MRACVVYESLWGNTAAIAAAIAEGFGGGSEALSTDEATSERIREADVLVVGAPVMAFRLPTDGMRARAAADPAAPRPGDTSHPPVRSWLEAMPGGWTLIAAFETRLRWSPGGSTGAIERALTAKGYRRFAHPAKFVVKGSYGPLRDGELNRARDWGRLLAELAAQVQPVTEAAA
ncbi:MAG TPA: hypothetical protein VFI34_10525 [Candidatus Limnocylindrales bacterium]|nr:hypothetical protein [Candidatus Limnocylindrales bacterium]